MFRVQTKNPQNSNKKLRISVDKSCIFRYNTTCIQL